MCDLPAHYSLAMDVSLPYAFDDLPGIGGVLKTFPEDFVVEELPAYEPAGEGDHAFLWIEKRNITTQQAVRRIAQVTGTAERDIGSAGLKDRVGVCRQFISIPADRAERVADVDDDSIRVLNVRRHRNKLRTGHLKGNAFSILVRDVCNDAIVRASAIQERVLQKGFPNYYGEQRFGDDCQTAQTGIDLLQGRLRTEDLPPRRRRFLLRFSLSAAQSLLFNAALKNRLSDDLLWTVLPGDVMQVTESGGIFVAEDVLREQERFEVRETVVTGPIFGPKMRQPQGDVAARERELLDEFAVDDDAFRRFSRLTRGTRRPYVVWPEDLSITPQEGGLQFRFKLPAGTYATTLLREFLRT